MPYFLTRERIIAMSKKISLDKSVEDLKITWRVYNCFKSEGIRTIGDLIKKTRADLLRMTNIGKVSVDQIEMELKKYGLKLAPKKIVTAQGPDIRFSDVRSKLKALEREITKVEFSYSADVSEAKRDMVYIGDLGFYLNFGCWKDGTRKVGFLEVTDKGKTVIEIDMIELFTRAFNVMVRQEGYSFDLNYMNRLAEVIRKIILSIEFLEAKERLTCSD